MSVDDPASPDRTASGVRDDEDHVIDMGLEPVPHGRPLDWRVIAVVLAVCAAGVIGYAVGDRQGPITTNVRETTPSAIVPAALGVVATGVTCSEQEGTTLRLGARIANHSPDPIVLDAIGVELPGNGLALIGTAWGECVGAASAPPSGVTLRPGDATWVSAVVAVHVPCPGAYPVIFEVDYGHGEGMVRAGFNDLAAVPYTGCQSSSN
jgi:hypothetical protein